MSLNLRANHSTSRAAGQSLLKLWLLVAGAALLWVTAPEATAAGACTCARMNDWQKLCQLVAGWGGFPVPPACAPCGMPRWSVSEPYISLNLVDTPLSYTMSSGKEMDFTFYYRQRTGTPASDQSPITASDIAGTPKDCPTTTRFARGLNEANISINGKVANVDIGFIENVTGGLKTFIRDAMDSARAQGADTAVVNTGPIINDDLLIKLGQASQNGETIFGGTVKVTTPLGVRPQFTITIPLR